MSKWTTEYYREYYHQRRKEILDYLGGKCVVCGATDDLEIDHIDRTQKSFAIGSRMSLKNNIEEIDKCQLLCSTHHREKTALENSGFQHGTSYAWMKKKCRCEICEPIWRAWHDERNAKRRVSDGPRGPYNKPVEHGDPLSYTRGCRCDLCRAANTQKERERRAQKKR